jgi:SulP family sulfate permease
MPLREILPITAWLGSYSLKRLGPDGVAGLSLAAFVIPESLAYASLAGLPPVSGLYCYLAAGLAYAVFGTSRQLAVGPTSALALAVAAGIAAFDGGDPTRAAALAAAIALMVGAIAIGGRFLGLANLAYFFSDSVLTGFKTAPPSISPPRSCPSSWDSKAAAAISSRAFSMSRPCCPMPRFRRS